MCGQNFERDCESGNGERRVIDMRNGQKKLADKGSSLHLPHEDISSNHIFINVLSLLRVRHRMTV